MRVTKVLTVVGSLVGSSALFLALAQPAFAHDRYHKYTDGISGPTIGSVRIDHNHRKLEVCDLEADGKGFSAIYQMANGQTARLGDGNGSQGGCGNTWTPSPITRWHIKWGNLENGWENA